jgi:hypothetical protein
VCEDWIFKITHVIQAQKIDSGFLDKRANAVLFFYKKPYCLLPFLANDSISKLFYRLEKFAKINVT